jgi:hypothetical protein
MLKDINKATILFSAIFLILGYLLGHCEDCGNSGCDDRGASCHYTQCDKSSSCDKSKCNKSKCNKSKCNKGAKSCKFKGAHGEHQGVWISEDGDVEVIVAKIMDGDFQGDTTIAIPGGEAVVHIDGEQVRVEVIVTEEHEHGEGRHSHN